MLVPRIKDNDWTSVRQAVAKLASSALGPTSSPTFAGVTLTDLTASLLVQTDSNKALASVSNLTSWIAGTTNRVTVADDSDGTVTLSGPQDIHMGASPTFNAITLDTGISTQTLWETISEGAAGLTGTRIINSAASGVSIRARRTRGGAFTYLQDGDLILEIRAIALRTATSYRTSVVLEFRAGGEHHTGGGGGDESDIPGEFAIKVTREGSSIPTERFTIKQDGATTINGTLNSGAITLTANSDITVSGTGHITSGSEGFKVGRLTITAGYIADLDGTITFAGTDLTSVGTIGCGAITSSGSSSFDSPTLEVDATNHRVGIGTKTPNAPLEVKGLYPGSVGGFSSGLLHVTTGDNSQYANSVITGHNSYTTQGGPAGNTQLWYLGSTSNQNNDIAFTNRQDGALSLKTNGITGLTITRDGIVGIGTTSSTGQLHLKGGLSTVLTGTVTTDGTTAIVGAGTNFDNGEIEVGDAIKIESDVEDGYEIFTVSAIANDTHLTLDSAYAGNDASGLWIKSDPDLFIIDTGDGINLLTVTKSGRAGLGTASPDQQVEVRGVCPIIRIRATGTIGDAAAYVEFGRTTGGEWVRTGYVGDAISANEDIYLVAKVNDLKLGDSSNNAVLTLSGGDATFSGDVLANEFNISVTGIDHEIFDSSGDLIFKNLNEDKDITWSINDGSTQKDFMKIDSNLPSLMIDAGSINMSTLFGLIDISGTLNPASLGAGMIFQPAKAGVGAALIGLLCKPSFSAANTEGAIRGFEALMGVHASASVPQTVESFLAEGVDLPGGATVEHKWTGYKVDAPTGILVSTGQHTIKGVDIQPGSLLTNNAGATVDAVAIEIGNWTGTQILGSLTTAAIRSAGGDWLMNHDSATGKFKQGAAQDVSMSFDGSDWIFNSENVTADDEIHFTNFDKYTFDNIVHAGGAVNYTELAADGSVSFAGTSRIDWTKITADSVTLSVGSTPSDLVSLLQTAHDGNLYHIDEANGIGPAITFIVDFVSVTAFNWVNILCEYDGSATHTVCIELYNWNTTNWDIFDSANGIESGQTNHDFFVPSDTDYIGTGGDVGKVRILFGHPANGIAAHDLDIDVVALYQ